MSKEELFTEIKETLNTRIGEAFMDGGHKSEEYKRLSSIYDSVEDLEARYDETQTDYDYINVLAESVENWIRRIRFDIGHIGEYYIENMDVSDEYRAGVEGLNAFINTYFASLYANYCCEYEQGIDTKLCYEVNAWEEKRANREG